MSCRDGPRLGSFWESGSLNWDAHRTDWTIGACSVRIRSFQFSRCIATRLSLYRHGNHLLMFRVPTLPVCVPCLPLSLYFLAFHRLRLSVRYIQNIYQPCRASLNLRLSPLSRYSH
ncbi:hypothetical protein K435DRAFT_184758 [Dendrothele bispora CBS 962.96]|uniref:Uncharacterized protein n=1 Tax=Dendrothele bispora (strain CBS 962.96) TaxID=1314807 RepID=A0A4S8KL26_DENBC|nr:hypothetical protein K435DRAFT_184758 [Dendrothele bispora CBS 962.96]